MPFYECNEHQFVENIRRFIGKTNGIIVNRKMEWRDDAKYGPSILPDDEFQKYNNLFLRKTIKSTVYAKIHFMDKFHKRFFFKDDILHRSTNLNFPYVSIPYYKVEYSVNIWGSTYYFHFDTLFYPKIEISKISNKTIGKNQLIHTLDFVPPSEEFVKINLPDEIIIFDVKNMIRNIDNNEYVF